MSFEIKGLKELQNKLDTLAKNTDSIDGQSVPLTEILTADFVASSSRFASAQELFDASGFSLNSPEDFKMIPDDEWDEFISKNTSYQNWSEMRDAAIKQWVKGQLEI